MASIYLYRDGDKFVARVNRGLRGAEGHRFDTREEAEQFAREHVGLTGNIRSDIDTTDEQLARRAQANKEAYNG